MGRVRRSPRLQELLVSRREAAGLMQMEVAPRLRRPQSFVSKYETGEQWLEVVELIEVAEAVGFNALPLLAELIDMQGA